MIGLRAVIERARGDEESTEAGITLVEIMVSLLLTSLILAMIASLFVSTSKTTAQSQAIQGSTAVASNMANELSRVIRVAVPLAKTGSTDGDPAVFYAGREALAVYSDVDVDAYASISVRPTKPRLVKFELNAARQLVESRWDPTASGTYWVFAGSDPTAVTAATKRNLGGNVSPAGTTPLFTYFNSAGQAIAAPATGSMTADLRATIRTICITVSVVPAAGAPADPVVVSNSIDLANLGLVGVS